MDVSAVRPKNPQTGESLSHDAGTGTAVQGLIATFSDMLRNAGVRMESDASSLMPKAKADVTATQHDAEAAERTRRSRPERRDDAAAPAERPRRARNAEENARKDVTKPAEESVVSEKADRAKTPASAASEANAPAGPKESAGTERPADPANAPVETAAGGETAASQDETAAALDQTAVASAEAAPPPSPTDFVAGVLATQLFAQSGATGADPATAAADTVSAVDDLSVAVTTAGQGKTAGDAGLAAAMAASANADASASATISTAAAKTAAAQPQVTPG
ncbi:MAG: hypothetical protein IH626_08125, partial [Rhodospirillales bacterium]|nr:hypothetical protein [Rhodospirillales bacterium]